MPLPLRMLYMAYAGILFLLFSLYIAGVIATLGVAHFLRSIFYSMPEAVFSPSRPYNPNL